MKYIDHDFLHAQARKLAQVIDEATEAIISRCACPEWREMSASDFVDVATDLFEMAIQYHDPKIEQYAARDWANAYDELHQAG